MRTVLDRPVAPDPFEQLARAGHRPRDTGDERSGPRARSCRPVTTYALDLPDLGQHRANPDNRSTPSSPSASDARIRPCPLSRVVAVVHRVIPDPPLPRGKKPLPREGRRPPRMSFRSVGWFSLTNTQVSRPSASITCWERSRWQKMASPVTRRPCRTRPVEQSQGRLCARWSCPRPPLGHGRLRAA